ncbi:hypothetical protein L9F63_025204 [Diploptera punctata]|uniref:Cilia- and flagella-associated protein 157 n=1 Tax=Diploptera punctata TaxID=6984 RepID=A0AAD7ZCS8_DIPPU|nr:hypothetical protein L9F63_025204 [Diploptera punctata]
MVRMVEDSKRLTEENEKMKARDRTLKLEVNIREDERDIALEKSMVQHKLIKRLSAEYEVMAKHIGELQYAARRYKDLQQELKDNAAFLDRAVKQIRMLEECLQAANYENSELNSKLLNAEKDTYLLQRVLREAVRSIKEALQVTFNY